jgi:hypothetical protein
MSTPSQPDPYGQSQPPQDPGYPVQQPGQYGQQPGQYDQQPGYPVGQPPAYPSGAADAAQVASARPGVVTAAAVLAFVIGGLGILLNLLAFNVLSSLSFGGLLVVLAILTIIADAALIWGGVQLLNGKDGRILVIAAAALVVINLIAIIRYFYTGGLLSLVIPALIIALMLQPATRNWLRSRGAATF